MLGELAISDGQRQVRGKVGYSSQQPWIFSGTVKENIVFGQEFNKDRYQQVIKACALKKVCPSLKNTKFAICTSSKCFKCTRKKWKPKVMQNFGGQTRCIMGDVQMASEGYSKLLFDLLNFRPFHGMFTRARMKLGPLCDSHFLLLLQQPIATHLIFFVFLYSV